MKKFVSDLPKTFSLIDDSIQEQYQLTDQIGEGSYATVFKAQRKSERSGLYAIKRLMVDLFSQEFTEVDQLKALQGDHIIQFYGYSLEGSQLNLVMKLCSGSLRTLMQQEDFTDERLNKLLVQVTSAMLKLNAHNVMHLDLKPENILYQNADFFKVCDFGCAHVLGQKSRALSKRPVDIPHFCFGTPLYVPPEIQLSLPKVHKNSCDVWSMGVILYEIIFNKFPFSIQLNTGKYIQKELQDFTNGKFTIDFATKKKTKLIPLLKRMLERQPLKRITWKQIKTWMIQELYLHEAEFGNVSQEGRKLVTMFKILQAVTKLIQENQNNTLPFWTENRNQLSQLQDLLMIYNYYQFQHFRRLFSYKFDDKFSEKAKKLFVKAEEQALTTFMKIFGVKVDQKIRKKGNSRNQISYIEANMFQRIRSISQKVNNKDKKWASVAKLDAFLAESELIKDLFCRGHLFEQTIRKFEIITQF